MEGIFKKSKYSRFTDWMTMILGICMAVFPILGLCSYQFSVDEQISCVLISCFGALIALMFGLVILWSKRVFLRVEEERITGFAHWGGRLDRSVRETISVQYEFGTLEIRFEDGKKYFFYHIINAVEIGRYLQRYRKPHPAEGNFDAMTAEIQRLTQERKKYLKIVGVVLIPLCLAMVSFIAFSVDERFASYPSLQAGVMIGSIAIAMVSTVAVTRLAVRAGETQNQRNILSSSRWNMMVKQAPVQPGILVKRFYENFGDGRICVYQSENGFYYIEEKLDGEFKPYVVYRSGEFPSLEPLWDDLELELGFLTEIEDP